MTYDEKTMIEMYTNWYPILNIINDKQNKTILELGCGIGTKKLCQEFKSVYSFETALTDEWFLKTTIALKEFNNWTGYFKNFNHYGFDYSDPQLLSSNGTIRNKEPLKKYLEELETFIDLNQVDVAFVDQGFHNRGESVNFFLSKNIPIIFAHDWNSGANLYGWNLIDSEKYNYKKHEQIVPTVCMWIK